MASRLDRKLVVDTALRLLNEVGLDGLTLRRIAKELNVQAPALYWHFKNKQALLDEMATEMLRRMIADGPDGPDDAATAEALGMGWQDMVIGACSALRRELLGYRDGAKVFSGTRMTDDSAAQPLEIFLGRFVDAGFTPDDAARCWWTAYNFTIGQVIEEQSVYPVPGAPEQRSAAVRDPAYDLTDRERRLGADYPLAARAGRELFDEMDRGFEAGLRVIVAGIEATMAPRKATAPRREAGAEPPRRAAASGRPTASGTG
ncbi:MULTISPECIES: TetR/AcrR family transcriptional regulator C-terminal domain-containing protein [Streptomyces]|uniref:TetR family transcriptional regulator n=1 Tax=Streptomyces kasugaensis TaxID=1946 RepID=A0A4Q9HM16_STRKA|nr:TetR/AcrR family transcriptional regulator C-terminal domain-containing protein [Streptomyces kasugaensis]TBO55843.1 TetR family transcriptional regulator [Streptomyces kasugaensis]